MGLTRAEREERRRTNPHRVAKGQRWRAKGQRSAVEFEVLEVRLGPGVAVVKPTEGASRDKRTIQLRRFGPWYEKQTGSRQ